MTPEEYLKKYSGETLAGLIELGKEFSKHDYEVMKARQASRLKNGKTPIRTAQHVIDIYEANQEMEMGRCIVNWISRNGEAKNKIFPSCNKGCRFYDWMVENHPDLDIKPPIPL